MTNLDRTNIFEHSEVLYNENTIILPRVFESFLKQTSQVNKKSYSDIKNALMSYSGVKSRMLKYDEVFRASGVLAKIRIRRKSLYVYLRIDPSKIDFDYLKVADKSHRNGYSEVPCEIKVTGKRKAKRTIELIHLIGEAFELGKKRNFEPIDYSKKYLYIENAIIDGKNKVKSK